MVARSYASLMGPMLGVYYPLPFDNELQNRAALNTSRLSKLWCSVYTRDEVERQIKDFGGLILPDEFAGRLDYDAFAVEKCS
jgi:hypothetical protein